MKRCLPPNSRYLHGTLKELFSVLQATELRATVRTVPYDAVETGSHQAFVDGIFDEGTSTVFFELAHVYRHGSHCLSFWLGVFRLSDARFLTHSAPAWWRSRLR